MILFENEIVNFLSLPSIPKKEWDGKSAFKKGVAVVKTLDGYEAYAVASYNPETDSKPQICKVFGYDPFSEIVRVYIVPDYMETNVETADLDDESKRRAEMLAKEAKEIEEEGVEEEIKAPEHEYYFEHITNDEEAAAYIDAYNKRNKLKRAKVPKTHDGLVMRLAVIYNETNKK